MKKDDDFDDDQTSTRLKVYDKARVLESGKSVIMVAWRAGMWRRNLKVFFALVAIVIGIFLWKGYNNKEVVDASATNSEAGQTDSNKSGVAAAQDINYKQVGRGLVFSCANKTFYCLDKSDYFKCRDHMKAGKPDCITRGVLESTELCLEEAKSKKPSTVKCP